MYVFFYIFFFPQSMLKKNEKTILKFEFEIIMKDLKMSTENGSSSACTMKRLILTDSLLSHFRFNSICSNVFIGETARWFILRAYSMDPLFILEKKTSAKQRMKDFFRSK